ncbi:MAG: HNH endonuclease [bacterium]|nr:HNH endonuclease [bacterium]
MQQELANLERLLPSQQAIHNNFVHSLHALHRDLVRAAYYLLQVRQRQIHRALGFASITDYAQAAAGLSPAQCRSFLELARNLADFPDVEKALQAGSLSWSQARMICRRARPEDQKQWLELAATLTSAELGAVVMGQTEETQEDIPASPRQLELTVQAPVKLPSNIMRPRGEAPFAAPIPASPVSLAIKLRFTIEQYARWQRLAEAARRRGNLEEAVLEGLGGANAGQDGDSSVPLVVMLACPTCGRASCPTSRGEFTVPRPMLEAGMCDAVVEDADGNRRRTVNQRLRRRALQRARYRCESPGCECAVFLQVHHIRPVAEAGENKLENLKVLCWRCHRTLHATEDAARQSLKESPE